MMVLNGFHAFPPKAMIPWHVAHQNNPRQAFGNTAEVTVVEGDQITPTIYRYLQREWGKLYPKLKGLTISVRERNKSADKKLKKLIKTPGSAILYAPNKQGEFVASVLFTPIPTPGNTKAALTSYLYIEPSERKNQALKQDLIKKVIEQARSKGIDYVLLVPMDLGAMPIEQKTYSDILVRFYHRWGFQTLHEILDILPEDLKTYFSRDTYYTDPSLKTMILKIKQ